MWIHNFQVHVYSRIEDSSVVEIYVGVVHTDNLFYSSTDRDMYQITKGRHRKAFTDHRCMLLSLVSFVFVAPVATRFTVKQLAIRLSHGLAVCSFCTAQPSLLLTVPT